jgi:hypothetical protein
MCCATFITIWIAAKLIAIKIPSDAGQATALLLRQSHARPIINNAMFQAQSQDWVLLGYAKQNMQFPRSCCEWAIHGLLHNRHHNLHKTKFSLKFHKKTAPFSFMSYLTIYATINRCGAY